MPEADDLAHLGYDGLGDGAGEAEESRGIGAVAAPPRKIEDARGGEGVERTAGVGHGDGNDGGEEQAGKSHWHFAEEKKREDAIGALPGGEDRGALRENEKQDAKLEEKPDVRRNDLKKTNRCVPAAKVRNIQALDVCQGVPDASAALSSRSHRAQAAISNEAATNSVIAFRLYRLVSG